MYNNNNSSLAIVSSILFPYQHVEDSNIIRKRQLNTKLPGTWIDEEEEQEESSMTLSNEPPRLTLPFNTSSENIDLLKQTIENLRKEKERLEETDHLVKQSIQIVAQKRLKMAQKREEEEIYIITTDYVPSAEEMKEAGLDGWEWITVY